MAESKTFTYTRSLVSIRARESFPSRITSSFVQSRQNLPRLALHFMAAPSDMTSFVVAQL